MFRCWVYYIQYILNSSRYICVKKCYRIPFIIKWWSHGVLDRQSRYTLDIKILFSVSLGNSKNDGGTFWLQFCHLYFYLWNVSVQTTDLYNNYRHPNQSQKTIKRTTRTTNSKTTCILISILHTWKIKYYVIHLYFHKLYCCLNTILIWCNNN